MRLYIWDWTSMLEVDLVAGASLEADAAGARGPCGIVEGLPAAPGVADRAGGNEHSLGGAVGDELDLVGRRARRARDSRVGAVERVPDHAAAGHREGVRRSDVSPVPVGPVDLKYGRGDLGIEPAIAELIEHDLRAGGEEGADQVAVDLRPPVRLRVRIVDPGGPLVAPAGGLADDGQVDLVGAGQAQGDGLLRRHHAGVEEVLVRVVGELHSVLRMDHQLLVQPLRVEVIARLAGGDRTGPVVVDAAS